MIVNRIKEIFTEKGAYYMRPSDETLTRLNVTIHTWNKWVNKKSDPELWQVEIIADMLGVSISEIIDRKLQVA